jgi:hypothetical protein
MSSFALLVVLRPLHSISLSLSMSFSHRRLALSLEVSPEIRELIANGVTLGSTSQSHKTAWGVLNAVCQRAFSSFGSILLKANPSRECDNRSGFHTMAHQENLSLFISEQHAQSICRGYDLYQKGFILLFPSVAPQRLQLLNGFRLSYSRAGWASKKKEKPQSRPTTNLSYDNHRGGLMTLD